MTAADRTTPPPAPLSRRVSLGLAAAAAALCAYSVLMMYTATHGRQALAVNFPKQIAWVAVGFVLAAAVSAFDYARLANYFPQLYGLNLALLAGLFVFGSDAKGAQRWYDIGPLSLQPSELAKLLVILTVGSYIVHRQCDVDDLGEVAKSFALILPPMALIMLQPDLGTALVLVATWLGMLFAAGLRWQYVLLVVVVLLAVGLLAWQLHILKDYQINRLIVFVNPDVDPSGAGYNLKQSKIAIGSGGVWGKGLLSGTQTNLNFLPERHTDFIFAVLGEELGFVGAGVLLVLYGWLMLSGLRVGSAARDSFGGLVAAGIVTMWLFQVAVNVGMTTGIMPVTGIPLPFISYGGSSMWTHLIATGLLLSIWWHRRPRGVQDVREARPWREGI